jgi:hypothetical protein
MTRAIFSAAVAATVIATASAQQSVRAKLPPGVPEIVPDPDWEPREGARATILEDAKALDPRGITKLEKGTEVQVVWYVAPPRRGGRTMSTSEYLQSIQEAGARPKAQTPARVRVLSGAASGKEFQVLDSDLGVLIPNPRPWLPSRPGDAMALWDAAVPLAADMEAYAAIRRDPGSVARLITRGRAFRLKPGAKVVVVDVFASGFGTPGFEVSRVRVLPGALHAGKVGFAFRGNLVPPAMAPK